MDIVKKFLLQYNTPFFQLQAKKANTPIKNMETYIGGIRKMVGKEAFLDLIEDLAQQDYKNTRKNIKNFAVVRYAQKYVLENPLDFDASFVQEIEEKYQNNQKIEDKNIERKNNMKNFTKETKPSTMETDTIEIQPSKETQPSREIQPKPEEIQPSKEAPPKETQPSIQNKNYMDKKKWKVWRKK